MAQVATAVNADEKRPEGAQILDEFAGHFGRSVSFQDGTQEHYVTLLSMWCLGTHGLAAFNSYPRLAILAPTENAGKSTTLKIVTALAHEGRMIMNTSPAALFRLIHLNKPNNQGHPTICLDEGDSFMEGGSDFRNLINAGYDRTGSALRCVGDNNVPTEFAMFSPLCIARIGDLPAVDGVHSRTLKVWLVRARADEKLERFKPDAAKPLHQRATDWGKQNVGDLRSAEPGDLPKRLNRNSRNYDNWAILSRIAMVVGDGWPERVAAAAEALEGDGLSGGEAVLAKIKEVFDATGSPKISSAELAEKLTAKVQDDDDVEFRSMTPRSMSKQLKPFDIKPGKVWIGGSAVQGYSREQFDDAFARYVQ